jgi:hypothetical protein
MEAARLDIEIFRTREATNRMQDRAHQWNKCTSGANSCLNWLPALIVSVAAVGLRYRQPTQTWRNMEKAGASKPATNTRRRFAKHAILRSIKGQKCLGRNDKTPGQKRTQRQ